MKKKINLFAILAITATLLTVCALLFPIGPGVHYAVTSGGYVFSIRGYDFVFGNSANQLVDPNGAYICAFALLIIAVVFQILGTVFTLPNPEASHKFSGFLHLISCLCLIVVSILVFSAPGIADHPYRSMFTLAYGFTMTGICTTLSAISSFECFVLEWFKESK